MYTTMRTQNIFTGENAGYNPLYSFTLVVARHGETQAGLEGLLQGHVDVPLSDTGRRQAAALGRQLGWRLGFDRIVASDLSRAKETAALVESQIDREEGFSTEPDLTRIETSPEFRERDFGPYSGQPRISLPVNLDSLYAANVEGVEPWENRYAQVAGGFRRIFDEARPNDVILVVAHNWSMNYLANLLLGESPSEHGPRAVAYGDYFVFSIDRKNAVVGDFKPTKLSPAALHWDPLYEKQTPKRGCVWSDEPSDFVAGRVLWDYSGDYRSVLDLGCGDFRNLIPFLEAGFDCVGIDASQQALLRARDNAMKIQEVQQRVLGRTTGSYDLLFSDLSDFRLKRRFDVIMSTKVLKHIWDAETVMQRVAEHLAPRGETLLEFATMDDSSRAEAQHLGGDRWQKRSGTPYRFYSRDGVHNLAENVGLRVIGVERREYWDEPHNELSTGRHKHESWIVRATHQHDIGSAIR